MTRPPIYIHVYTDIFCSRILNILTIVLFPFSFPVVISLLALNFMKKGAEVFKEEINLFSALTIPLPQPFMATYFEAVEQLPAGKYKLFGI